ncbi:hypothetical protein [Paraburkholderia sacchari]|uniref:hypothetical protein n=1 Tax=Paraburkholderia sacchari TaxID=159450 RepID=UPI001BCC3464|nr:hypothetical protein [Paraburkholderia sacchari]
MNALTSVMTMLAQTPYLAVVLAVTFGLLGGEAWIVRSQARAHDDRCAEGR